MGESTRTVMEKRRWVGGCFIVQGYDVYRTIWCARCSYAANTTTPLPPLDHGSSVEEDFCNFLRLFSNRQIIWSWFAHPFEFGVLKPQWDHQPVQGLENISGRRTLLLKYWVIVHPLLDSNSLTKFNTENVSSLHCTGCHSMSSLDMCKNTWYFTVSCLFSIHTHARSIN